MPRHFEKRIVPYSTKQMFDLVADVARYPEFLPWCLGVDVVRSDETSLKAILLVGYGAFRDTFTSHVTLDPYKEISVAYGGGPLKSLSNTWAFESIDDKRCEISFFVAFEFKSIFLGAVMDLFFDKAFCRMVSSFETRAEQLYGA